MEKTAEKNMVFSYSRAFGVPCYRAMVKLLNHEPPEVLPEQIAERGTDVHVAIEDFIITGNDNHMKEVLPQTAESIISEIKDLLGRHDLVCQTVEKVVEYEYDGVPIKGQIDWYLEFKDEIWIIDFKSGFFNKILPHHKEQLRVYAYPFLKWPEKFTCEKKKKPVATFVWNVNLYGLVGLFSNTDLNDADDQIRKIEVWFRKQKRKIEQALKNPDATHVSYYCFFCPYSLSCPAAKVVNERSPEEIARAYLVSSARTKQLKKLLEGIVNVKGNIKVDDTEIGYHYGEETSVDFGELFTWLVKKHRELIPELLRANIYAIKKYAKKYDELANFVEIKPTRRWGEKKIKEE